MGMAVCGLGASESSETADLLMERALENSRNTHHLHMGSAHFPLRQTKKKEKEKMKESPQRHINQAQKHTANSKPPDEHSQIGTWCLQLWGWRNLGLGSPKAGAAVPKAGTAASEGAGVPSAGGHWPSWTGRRSEGLPFFPARQSHSSPQHPGPCWWGYVTG